MASVRTPVAAQVVDAGVGYPVVRQAGDEFALQAVVGQRYGDVGLASAVAGAEEVRLVETQVVGGVRRSMISPKVTIFCLSMIFVK